MAGFVSKIFFELGALLCTFLFIATTVLLLLICIPLFFYRQLVIIVAKLFRRDLAKIVPSTQQLIAHDRFHEDHVNFNIVTWQIFEGSFSINNVRKLVEENLVSCKKPDGGLEFPEFQQYTARFGGYLFWKWDKEFDISNHVRYYEPENRVTTEEDLQRIVSRLISAKWPEKRSLWEVLVINNYRPTSNDKEKCIYIFRFHHMLADGYSYLNFTVRKLCKADNPVAAVPQVLPRLSLLMRIGLALLMPLRQPYDFVKLFMQLNYDANPWKIPIAYHRHQYTTVWSQPIQLDIMKKLKVKFGVNFQSVMLTIIGGVVRRLMERANQNIPRAMTAFVPFPSPLVKNVKGLGVNPLYTLVRVPVGEKVLKNRLQATQRAWKSAVRSTAKLMAQKVGAFLGWLPWAATEQLNVLQFNTLAISCFPGILGDIYFDNKKVLEVNFAVGTERGSTAAAFSTLSCFGTLRVVLTIDKAIYPWDNIGDDFDMYVQEEINALMELPSLNEPETIV